jgi:hypothetical protein
LRQGISLLEVLFAMFVLAVGLLGLAAMVPVGKHQVTEATHADRSTAIGVAAHNEIKVRDWLDPGTWAQRNFVANTWDPFTPSADNPTFIIDPLSVAANMASGSPDAQYNAFPYGTATFVGGTPQPLYKIPRISVFIPTNTVPGVAMADRLFRSLDDRMFELPADATLRPRVMMNGGVPLPTQSQSEGNYSWLVMVSPPGFPGGPSTVSVVVFYKRDLVVDTSNPTAPPSERFVYLDLINGGLGGSFGGDAQLRETTSANAQAADKVLKVRPHQWILVSGQLSTPVPGSSPAVYLPVHKWYRVVSTSEMQSTASPWIVDVTLSGPDWNASAFRDVDGTGGKTMFATICDGVVGVFEKTVQLDEPSLWTTH